MAEDTKTLFERRAFLRALGGGAALLTAGGALAQAPAPREPKRERGIGKPGAPVPVAKRLAALKAVNALIRKLPRKNRDAENKEVLRFLLKRPEFQSAWITSDGCVRALFTDGREYTFYNNYWPDKEPAPAKPAPGKPAPVSGLSRRDWIQVASSDARALFTGGAAAALAARGAGARVAPVVTGTGGPNLPNSIQARMLCGLGYSRDAMQEARKLLLDRGYTFPLAMSTDASLENLTKVKGDGVFLLETHGDELSLTTTTRVSDKMEASDLVNEKIEDIDIFTGKPISWRGVSMGTAWIAASPATPAIVYPFEVYCINRFFIKKYMKFADDSLVWVNACSTFSKHLIHGFKAANASVYASWTNTANAGAAEPALLYALDRLLGANEISPEEDPWQRAFDIDSVYADMEKEGHAKHRSAIFLGAETTLGVEKIQGAFAVLAPSIQHAFVHETNRELKLTGIFGDDPGTVTVNNVDLTVKKWEPDEIVCDLPAANAPGGAGPVAVKVRGIKSNTVPITLWHGRFEYGFEMKPRNASGSVTQNYVFDAWFRQDIHAFRRAAGQDPEHLRSVSAHLAPISTCHHSAGGTFVNGSQQSTTWEADRLLGTDQEGSDTAKHFISMMDIDPAKKSASVFFNVSAGPLAKIKLTFRNGPVVFVNEEFNEMRPCDIKLTLNDDGSIQAGSQDVPQGTDIKKAWWKWERIEAKFPPEPGAKGYAV